MKKIMYLIAVLLIFASLSKTAKSSYKIADEKIEALFESATEVDIQFPLNTELVKFNFTSFNIKNSRSSVDDDTQLIAGAIALGGLFFTGGIIGDLIPVH